MQSREIIIRNLDVPENSNFYQVKNYVKYKISDKSNFGIGISYEKAEDNYDGILLRASINNSFNSKLTMRTKIQYSDFSNTWFIEPMITYQPNAFSALYFGINDLLETKDNMFSSLTESKRQLFIKFQYRFKPDGQLYIKLEGAGADVEADPLRWQADEMLRNWKATSLVTSLQGRRPNSPLGSPGRSPLKNRGGFLDDFFMTP